MFRNRRPQGRRFSYVTYDAAGRLTSYEYEQVNPYGSSSGSFTHRFSYQYRGAASYLESRISGVSVTGKYHGKEDYFT